MFNVYVGGEDYKNQHYNTVRFVKGGSRYIALNTEFIKDNIVENDECYYLRIVPDTLPNRTIAVNPNYTKIVIQNDDGKYCLVAHAVINLNILYMFCTICVFIPYVYTHTV